MIEKNLNGGGIAEMMPEQEELDLTMLIDSPVLSIEMMDDDGVEITFGEADELTEPPPPFDANLAEYIDEDVLLGICNDMKELVEADKQSRSEWEQTLVDGFDAIGLKYEERTEPWEKACGVYSTLLSEAAIRFQAETMSETFPAAGPVRTKIIGSETQAKLDAADRVKADMNHQLTDRMVEYRPEHERLLYSLSLMGSAFKKVYQDPSLGRQTAMYLSAEDVIVPYGASHINTAERITHVMRKTKDEMDALQYNGFYLEVDLGEPTPCHSALEEKKAKSAGYSLTEDDRYTLYEIHANFHTQYDDVNAPPPPYVLTIEAGSDKVLGLYRNWREEDELKRRRNYFAHYTYVPGFGFYGLGLIHIIGGYAKAGTSLIRQLVDAGTLSNLPGGLKTRGLRIKGDDTPIAPGEFRDADVTSGTLKENIVNLPYKEPSATLLALLDRITEEGRRLGAVSEMNVSDMSAQAPVGTTLALLERTLKPMAAIQARIHYTMKQEFRILKEIIADNTQDQYPYETDDDTASRATDYKMVDVIPVSDPNSSTMAQRIVQYQAVLQLAETTPQIYDMPTLHRQMIDVLGVKNADKIIPLSSDMKPVDPVSENMNALVGKPVKAFIYQDHEAHLKSHQSFLQDPMIAQAIGQNPMGQQIMGALQAHIAEHTAFLYRKQLEERLGAPLTMPNEELPEEIEVQLSRLVADAGQQLSATHQQQAAQAQAQQQAQDPALQLEQAKVANGRAEVQRKAAKDAADIEAKKRENDRKDRELVVDAALEQEKIETDRLKANQKAAIDLVGTIKEQQITKNSETGEE